mmetsp:Transcript_46/g.109  ORF Transcript_46/g.109 Transcript_46/m.109 type:complete len:113 (+) Transcript_46:45-383(+)
MEESALDMERNGRRRSAVRKDAQTMLPKEEFAFDMGRNEIDYAATRVAQSMPTKQDCALSMEESQKRNDAATKVVQTWLKLEESVLSTGQSRNVNNAAARDVQIKFTAKEYA